MRKQTAFVLAALVVGVIAGSAAAAPIVTSIAQERSVSVSVHDFTTGDDHTLVSDASTELGTFDRTLEASYSVAGRGHGWETSFATVSQTSTITGSSISFSSTADAEISGNFNLTALSAFNYEFRADELLDITIDYKLWNMNIDFDPASVSMLNLYTGETVFDFLAHPSDYDPIRCPDGDPTTTCVGSYSGSLGSGTYLLSAGLDAMSYYTSGGSGPDIGIEFDLTFSRAIPEPSAALTFGFGALVIGSVTRRRKNQPR